MEMVDTVSAIFGLLALSGIIVILYGPWQWVWNDHYRIEMFSARAKLFDLATSGRMSFSSPVYMMMRDSLNDGIRFAHRATWTRLVWFGAWAKMFGLHVDHSRLISAASSVADEDVRAEIDQIIVGAQRALMKSMILRAPALWLPLLGYLLYRMFGGSRIGAAVIGGCAFDQYQAAAEGQHSMRHSRNLVGA